ncbi:hypothetical protein AMJ44_12910 [candidate division WOR-1 bacterium DG_54_3]|uniref:Core-binding (CB) domain-containing protein n=1 Tax=candidate division WOR-1 bacterium DG_54_3 TaxID=1703775 RepID=A0A0S7XQS5_UNCSA|nr:MAG: hypothetical protein AMJ44_12910 [candidate division WOR-1 bacterium DG_54_3]
MDEHSNILNAKSTGQTAKAAAENWAYEQLRRRQTKSFVNMEAKEVVDGAIREGKIEPSKREFWEKKFRENPISVKEIIRNLPVGFQFGKDETEISFGEYARDWWIWGKCEYIKRKLARHKSVSPGYADAMRSYLNHHILPYFKDKGLHQITTAMVEDWLFSLTKKTGRTGANLSATTANYCLTALRIMFNEAVKRGYLKVNSVLSIEPLGESPKTKGILTIDEVRNLFRDDGIEETWNGELPFFTINLLAASTGMRMGECLALKVGKVFKEHLSVHHSWSRRYGLKEPKSSSYRNIPIPRKTSAYLHELIRMSPYQEPEDLVFFGENNSIPIYQKIVLKHLYMAFERIGISSEERKTEHNLPQLEALLQYLFQGTYTRFKIAEIDRTPNGRDDRPLHTLFYRGFQGCDGNTGGILRLRLPSNKKAIFVSIVKDKIRKIVSYFKEGRRALKKKRSEEMAKDEKITSFL